VSELRVLAATDSVSVDIRDDYTPREGAPGTC
jgi:hypothetical protein